MKTDKDILAKFKQVLIRDLNLFAIGISNEGYDHDFHMKFVNRIMTPFTQLIKEVREEVYERLPMGVSQWKQHGKKYHYWQFWKKKALSQQRKQIIEKLKGMKVSEPRMEQIEQMGVTKAIKKRMDYNQTLDQAIKEIEDM